VTDILSRIFETPLVEEVSVSCGVMLLEFPFVSVFETVSVLGPGVGRLKGKPERGGMVTYYRLTGFLVLALVLL
jgi:hypothetical protein